MKTKLVLAVASYTLLTQILFSQNLALRIHMEQERFLLSQAIWVTAALVNNGSTFQEVPAAVLTEDANGIQIQLVTADGIKVNPSGVLLGDPQGVVLIEPEDSLSQSMNLIGMFSTSGDNNVPYLATMHYLKPGRYTVSAKQRIDKTILTSNILSFEVVEPVGSEKKALTLLSIADKRYLENRRQKGTMEAYDDLRREHPKSVYGPRAYHHLISLSYLAQDNPKVIQLLSELAHRYPDDDQAIKECMVHARVIFRNGRGDIFEKIASDLPQTRVGKLSRKILTESKH